MVDIPGPTLHGQPRQSDHKNGFPLPHLTLAKPDDLDRLDTLVASHHAEMEIAQDAQTRRAALGALLDGAPHGAAYLIGPVRAPIGYVVLSFGWSIRQGGMTATLDEVFIRPGVRNRGIGAEVLTSLPKALKGAGLKALHVETPRAATRPQSLYRRMRFHPRDDVLILTREV